MLICTMYIFMNYAIIYEDFLLLRHDAVWSLASILILEEKQRVSERSQPFTVLHGLTSQKTQFYTQ